MSKKIVFSAFLALSLAGGAVATVIPAPAVAAVPAAPQAVSVAPAAVVAADAAAVRLTPAQMAVVQGAGIFSFVKDLFKTVKKAIAGAIVSFFTNLFKSWIEQIFGVADGGQNEEKTQTVTEHYNSQADYDAGIIASTTTEETPWVVTYSWSGSCGGGGGYDGGRYLQHDAPVFSAC